MDRLCEQIIVDIINYEMDMPPDRVWIRQQNKIIPNTSDLFIVVGMVSSQPYGVSTRVENIEDGGLNEVQEGVAAETHQIDVFSRDNSALLRRFEVLLALRSYYSQQLQEKNNFQIARIPGNFVNTSDAEGGSNLNRFTLTISCQVWYRKTKVLASPSGDYYDDFTQRVDDANTVGTDTPLIAFEITPEGIT